MSELLGWASRLRFRASSRQFGSNRLGPGKRGNRKSEVLVRNMSGYPTMRPSERSSRGFTDTVFPSGVSIRRVVEALVQKVPDLFLRGRFLHDSLVHVGYSAFTVNERR